MSPIFQNIKAKYIFKSILFCVVFTGLFVLFSFTKIFLPDKLERLSHGVIGTLTAILTTILFLRYDGKQFSDVGLTFEPKTIARFFVGILTGIVIMGLLTAGVLYLSNASIVMNRESNLLHFLIVTSPLILLSFMEELGFRAYPLEILKDKIGIRLSIVITSILFALYHVANGWTIASSFYGPCIWGLIFGLAAVYSKGIAMPTGIHYAANLTTSAFGVANNNVSIWVVKETTSLTTKYKAINWTTILPPLVLLVLAIVFTELYKRRKAIASS